jgi:putative transposase
VRARRLSGNGDAVNVDERAMGLVGAIRRRAWTTTTRAALTSEQPDDLVDSNVTATRPNQLWVADFNYVAT